VSALNKASGVAAAIGLAIGLAVSPAQASLHAQEDTWNNRSLLPSKKSSDKSEDGSKKESSQLGGPSISTQLNPPRSLAPSQPKTESKESSKPAPIKPRVCRRVGTAMICN
jgi:hypothetical protein